MADSSPKKKNGEPSTLDLFQGVVELAREVIQKAAEDQNVEDL